MYSKSSLSLSIMVIFGLLTFANSFKSCVTQSPSVGCLTCTNSTFLAYNTSQSKYTCFSGTCSTVENETCVGCPAPLIIDSTTGQCLSNPGCLQASGGNCTQCDNNYQLINNICYEQSINYCSQYQLNSTAGQLYCAKCQYDIMDAANNCTVNSTRCLVFDYSRMKCIQCPNQTQIQSDGLGCHPIIENCELYDNSFFQQCLLCKQNFIYLTGNNSCVTGQSLGIMEQILLFNSTNTSLTQYNYLCLENSKAFNSTSIACDIAISGHCLINTTATACSQCNPGYYLRTSDSSCRECDVAISNCALCSSSTNCTSCSFGYYVLRVGTSSSKCMPCSSYGCLQCSTLFNADGQVQCISCPVNSTLYKGSCFKCQDNNFAYSIKQSQCVNCNDTVPNCRFCIFSADQNSPVTCIQCAQQYYYSTNTSSCQIIANSTIQLQFSNAYEILKKMGPGIQKVLYNDKNALMSACNQTDGYVCICPTNSTNQTSLCSSFKNLNQTPIINLLVFSTVDQIASYPDQLRMSAQFPSFTSAQITYPNSGKLTEYQFWNLLSAYSFIISRNQMATDIPTTDTTTLIAKIETQARNMVSVFSDQKITILRGNGFYFKFLPQGFVSGGTGDDDFVYTSLNGNNFVAIYIHFPRFNKTGVVTGTIYVITDNTMNFSVRVRKTRHFDNNLNLTSSISGSLRQNDTTTTLSNGFLTITDFPKLKGVFVQSSASSTNTDDAYATQRIENIFYSQSWLYILFFIALYLIFIPLCAIVDCCQSEQYMRKKVGSEEVDNKQSEDTTIVKVNYRDFFPLYNVGNTPRPRRLAKVCLFIINMMHIVTFLTLIYFNFPQKNPVGAIALVIPAYLCTVVMGYIVGAIFRALPGNFKYLINILALGYFILWFFLMRIMAAKSSQYRLYILVFSILCFFLDLVIDSLETLLVYFSIKQEEKQVSLFNCLAKWLSYRGYYQFDKLAKQIGGQQ